MTAQLTMRQKKAIALAMHLGDEFFFVNGVAYRGNEEYTRASFRDYLREKEGSHIDDIEDKFRDYCETECGRLSEYDSNNCDYLVVTEREADQYCEDYIRESLWAFNPSFLSDVTGIDEEVFLAIQANNRCESNNYAILRLVGDDIDRLIEKAVADDGRGHFLSSYDGEEHEIDIFGATGAYGYFYIYQC